MRRAASGPSPASERQAVAGKDTVRVAVPGEFEIDGIANCSSSSGEKAHRNQGRK